MKRVREFCEGEGIHASCKFEDILEKYGDMPIPKEVFKHYYPIEYRESMMTTALKKLKRIDTDRKSAITDLLTNKFMSISMKYNHFVDIMTEDELNYLGW